MKNFEELQAGDYVFFYEYGKVIKVQILEIYFDSEDFAIIKYEGSDDYYFVYAKTEVLYIDEDNIIATEKQIFIDYIEDKIDGAKISIKKNKKLLNELQIL
ncbi:MAG: hypothetical protein MJ204_02805 [Bacteroidales bacterium]|nr:hypothetical protein [Bacteroidales bacterium]MCQ2605458.1 hypothetical protein [Bacteroidales bacterium]